MQLSCNQRVIHTSESLTNLRSFGSKPTSFSVAAVNFEAIRSCSLGSKLFSKEGGNEYQRWPSLATSCSRRSRSL